MNKNDRALLITGANLFCYDNMNKANCKLLVSDISAVPAQATNIRHLFDVGPASPQYLLFEMAHPRWVRCLPQALGKP